MIIQKMSYIYRDFWDFWSKKNVFGFWSSIKKIIKHHNPGTSSNGKTKSNLDFSRSPLSDYFLFMFQCSAFNMVRKSVNLITERVFQESTNRTKLLVCFYKPISFKSSIFLFKDSIVKLKQNKLNFKKLAKLNIYNDFQIL